MHLRILSLSLLMATSYNPCNASYTSHPESFHLEESSLIIAPTGSVIMPDNMDDSRLLFKDREYYIVNPSGSYKIDRCNLDNNLRNFNSRTFAAFLSVGYLKVSSNDRNEYVVQSHVRGRGGGIALASLGWAAVELVGWGIPAFFCKDEINAVTGWAKGLWTANEETNYRATLRVYEERRRVALEEILKKRPYMQNIEPTYTTRADGTREVHYNEGQLNFPKSGKIPDSSYTYRQGEHVGSFEMVGSSWMSTIASSPFTRVASSTPSSSWGIGVTHNPVSSISDEHKARIVAKLRVATNFHDDLVSEASLKGQRIMLATLTSAAHVKEKIVDPINEIHEFVASPGEAIAHAVTDQLIQGALSGQGVDGKQLLATALATSLWNGSYQATVHMVAAKVYTALLWFPYF